MQKLLRFSRSAFCSLKNDMTGYRDYIESFSPEKKPSWVLHLENILHGDQERTLTLPFLPQCCRSACSMSCVNLLFSTWQSSLEGTCLPGVISSLRYLCNNSFSRCSLHKPISQMEQLIQQASISCQEAHGPSS